MGNDDFKMLFIDIETAPIEAYTWGLWQQNVNIGQIIAPTRMLSWAAKWEGTDEVLYASEGTHTHSDMVQAAYELVDEADVICHYNGTKFDMKHLHREFILEGLEPPTKYKNLDLLTVVKRVFSFPSNKLDYVTSALGVTQKMQHAGFQMWIDAMNGDKAAWGMMEDYNIQDVVILEELYDKVQGWIPSHPNRALWIEDQENPVCPNCGSTHVILKGVERPARVNAYQRYKCKSCGANSRGRTIVSRAGPGVLM